LITTESQFILNSAKAGLKDEGFKPGEWKNKIQGVLK